MIVVRTLTQMHGSTENVYTTRMELDISLTYLYDSCSKRRQIVNVQCLSKIKK